MRTVTRAFAASVLSVGLAACAHTSMTSMPAPSATGQRFQKILVAAHFADLGLRQQMEMRFASQSVAGQYQFVPSSQLMYPGRTYSRTEVDSIFRRYSIDAMLVIEAGGEGSKDYYIPPTATSTCTTSSCRQVTTTTSGGGTMSKPWGEFSAELYSVATGESVWVATARSRGNAYADKSDLVNSMADKTVKEMLTARVIQ